MRGFILLLFSLLFPTALFSAYADLPSGPGHIGCSLSRANDSDFLTVEYVAANSPAAAAGIKTGDGIAAIDDISTQRMSLAKARAFLYGNVGGMVNLTIRREGSPDQPVSIARRSLLDIFLPEATAGDPHAEFFVGYFYGFGPTSTRDLAKADEWFRKAADQGYTPAQVDLGSMYRNGVGVPKDLAIAAAWYLKAANQGDPFAESGLGVCYLKGEGVPQSDHDAFAWFYSAASQNDPAAEYYLGLLYRHGQGVTLDLKESLNWFGKAADQGYAPAQANLGYIYRIGVGVPQDLAVGAAWYLKAAIQGDSFAETGLGVCYWKGEGVRQSDQDAFDWFYSAARQDNSLAEYYLGRLYLEGRGVARDDRAAFAWYYRSAEQGNVYGERDLAFVYENGRGVTKNLGEALKWYQKAQAGLPEDEALKRHLVLISLKAFLENPASSSFDLSLLMSAFRGPILLLFLLLALVYVAGGAVLFYFSLQPPDVPPRLSVAFGWLVFFMEGQGVALLALFVFGKSLTADSLFAVTAFFSALPVIASSLGPQRNLFWKASTVSWKTLLLYGAGLYAINFIMVFGYGQIYALIAHAPIPSQPTQNLIGKAKDASAWLSFATIALVLPAAEEILFRGYLFHALQRRFSGKIVVVLTALAFSLAHFQVLYFVPLFGFGLILGWARLQTGSLRFSFFLHAMNNSLFLIFSV